MVKHVTNEELMAKLVSLQTEIQFLRQDCTKFKERSEEITVVRLNLAASQNYCRELEGRNVILAAITESFVEKAVDDRLKKTPLKERERTGIKPMNLENKRFY